MCRVFPQWPLIQFHRYVHPTKTWLAVLVRGGGDPAAGVVRLELWTGVLDDCVSGGQASSAKMDGDLLSPRQTCRARAEADTRCAALVDDGICQKRNERLGAD